MSLSLRGNGKTSCEIGGAILAAVALKDYAVQRFRVPNTLEWPWGLLAGVGFFLVATGLVVWAASGEFAIGSSLRAAVGRIAVSRSGKTFRFAFAKSARPTQVEGISMRPIFTQTLRP